LGEVPESLDSPTNLTNQTVSGANLSSQKKADDFSFSTSENIRSHEFTTVEKALNSFPLYNSKCQASVTAKKVMSLAEVESRLSQP
jgi:hypothetical protein